MGRHAAPVPPDLTGGLTTGALHLALHGWTGGEAPAEPQQEPSVDTGALQRAVQAWSHGPEHRERPEQRPPVRTPSGDGVRRLPTAPLPTGPVPVDTGALQQAVAAWSAAPAPAAAATPAPEAPAPAADADDEVLAGQVVDPPFAPRGARGTPAAAPSPMRAPSLAAPGLQTGPVPLVTAPAERPAQPGRIRAWWSGRRSRIR